MRIRRFAKDENGAAIVEFGVIFPFLMLIFCAILDFGFALFTLNTLTSSVREGGRFAAVLLEPTNAASQALVKQHTADIFNERVVGQKITAADVYFDPPTEANDWIATVGISASSYSYQGITPMAGLYGLKDKPMGRSAAFRWERATEPDAP